MHLIGDVLVGHGPAEVISTGIHLETNISSANTHNSNTSTDLGQLYTAINLKKEALDSSPICLVLTEINDHSKNLPTTPTEIVEKEKISHKSAAQKQVHTKSRTVAVLPPINRKHKLQMLIPDLNHFNIHRKIGCGTFSSVYLATLKTNSAQYAIKHHVPTASPARIEWEYKCLQSIGGCDNVCGIKAAFRQNDCTVFVMPYLPHVRFSDYILEMDVAETRGYIRGLLIALARVHSFNIIHRDVKPSNYLYDRKTKECLLVDFGLASESFEATTLTSLTPLVMEYNKRKRYALNEHSEHQPKRRALQARLDNNIIVPKSSSVASGSARKRRRIENQPPPIISDRNVCKNLFANDVRQDVPTTSGVELYLNTISKPAPTYLNGRIQPTQTEESSSRNASKGKALMAPRNSTNAKPKRPALKVQNATKALKGRTESAVQKIKNGANVKESKTATPETFQTLTPSNKNVSFVRVQNSQVKSVSNKSARKDLFALPSTSPQCTCFGKARVCSVCSTRRVKAAQRAGTPGFRPPEVLFKYAYQTTAVDMWAAGVVLLCIMSGSYPFFKSPDDLAALAEITMLFGSEKVKDIAKKLGRHVQFSDAKQPLNIRKLCETLRHRKQHSSRHDDTSSTSPDFLAAASRNDANKTLPQCSNCKQVKDVVSGCLCAKYAAGYPAESTDDSGNVFPASAYDLLTKLMDLNPHTRITAADALKHPFFKE